MTRRLCVDDLLDLAVPEQPALSPDGGRVAYVLRTLDAVSDSTQRNIWLVDAAGNPSRQLTFGNADTAPAWSPDGASLSFLRESEGHVQLYIMTPGDHRFRGLGSLPLGVGKPTWSPDGTKLAFAAFVPGRNTGSDAPVVADGRVYQSDGLGLLGTLTRQIHVLDVASGKTVQLTHGDWHARDPEWSPDGGHVAFAAGPAADNDASLVAPVHVLAVDVPDAQPVLVGPDDHVVSGVEWSAEGDALFVVSSRPVGHAAVIRLPLDGSPAGNLTASLDRNVMGGAPAYPGAAPRVINAGRSVLFCIRDLGCTHLYEVDVDGGEPRPVLRGDGLVVSELSVAGNTVVTVLKTPDSFGEIASVDLSDGAVRVWTRHGSNFAETEFFPRLERWFPISDGTVVQGWIIRDPESEGPQPLLLDIHGGPHNAWNSAADDVNLYHQELVARGWTVLLLNVRGSDGYGADFYRAALGKWGIADAQDFLEPLDVLVAEGVADPDRLAVTGYSYGGYMTCYLTSRDQRFAAAVAGGVVSDLRSLAGTSDSGQFLSDRELGGPAWTDAPGYEAMSPLSAVERVTTPTLIFHGADDVRCPVGQAEQWHAALCELGVVSRLVLYPGGSHLFTDVGRPSHRIDFNRRIVEWVEKYANGVDSEREPMPARSGAGVDLNE
ncbi:S9 family peptidase [Paenarthrobacter nitroguajacolicus]|uniref:S9 family peptidase n=1 Tax=Paenarthrobacter nitroguajacolicus TaxID=211146 RepID=A0A558GVJ0_PAENT|nr:S9 family peptidase [Paenarthrobacter nitroguajacolicus]TVU60891.1 S9 family peptidase [Paenarthrobacter nitroguajacolicus]